jgi:hypothetical protein
VKPIPPGYVALVRRLAQLTVKWCEREPTLPDLRWLDPGDTLFVGALRGKPLDFLVDSPDARRLCEWLDMKTNGEATVFQMTMALRMLGHLPGGPGLLEGEEEPEPDKSSEGWQLAEAFGRNTGTTTRLAAESRCPHCGTIMDAATGKQGHTPRVGDLGVCAECAGFIQYGEGFKPVGLVDADLDALGASTARTLREMRDLLRASKMRTKRGRGVQA